MRSLIIIVCIIFGPLLSIANAQEPAPRSRSAFIPNQTESKDLVLLMNQAQENEAVGEVSVYVPVRFRYDSSELTSWSSISDLDTVSLLTSISSLSFGEIISVSGEDEGELTADDIDDEVWDDYDNEGKGRSIN